MPLRTLTVLAVDDNAEHLYALGRSLHHFGAKVLTAADGSRAMELAKQKPDIILLDVNLPDANGFDICRSLKADPDTASIPVVFITATSQSTMAKQIAESVGAATLLFHPVKSDQLNAVILAEVKRARKN